MMEAVRPLTALLLLLCWGLAGAQEDDDMMQNKVSLTPVLPPHVMMVDVLVRETEIRRVVQQPGPPQLGDGGQSPGEEVPALLR